MANKTPKIKHRVRVKLVDTQGAVLQDHEENSTYVRDYGAYLRVPVPKTIGKPVAYAVVVEYLGEHQYKQTYQQRVKAMASSEKRREAWQKEQARLELERQEKELVQRRQRIVNQIELAFLQQKRGGVDFVTCDKCDAPATHLGLAYENPGSQVIDTEQITGAWCAAHDNQYARPFKTKATIACDRLEFFYDGLRQICIKAGE